MSSDATKPTSSKPASRPTETKPQDAPALDPGNKLGARAKAWDAPTRIFHWVLVASIASAWATYEYSEFVRDPTLTLHRYNGYAVLVLIVWRLLWGFAGSRTARFAEFVSGPTKVLTFARAFLTRREPKYLGHNPIAGYAIVAMLALVGTQAGLGLLSEEHNGTTWGPLFFITPPTTRAWITEFHGTLFYSGLLVIIGVHVASAAFHDLGRREGVTKAMVTGYKNADHFVDGPGLDVRPATVWIWAAVCLFAAVAIVAAGIILPGGRLFY